MSDRIGVGRRDGPTVIDYLPCPTPTKSIAVTFNSWNPPGAVDPEGTGYAAEVLLKAGFSVIAFKATRNTWYQDLGEDELDAAALLMTARGYTDRVAYGSSMGAFAALRFSTWLGIDRVLALSPQFEIDKPWDVRWAFEARELTIRYRADELAHLSVAPARRRRCTYFIAYDPYEACDAGHAARYAALLPAADTRLVPIPFAGHPVGPFLSEIRAIKGFAIGILKDGIVPKVVASREAKRASPAYLFQLSLHARAKKKPRLAHLFIDAGLQLNPAWSDLHLLKSMLFNETGDIPAATAAARRALECAPQAHHILHHLAYLTHIAGDNGEAQTAIDEAAALQPANAEYHCLRSAILRENGRIPEAIVAIERALEIAPGEPRFQFWLDNMRPGGSPASAASLPGDLHPVAGTEAAPA